MATTRTVIAGRYRLIEEIGAGGMGTVWRARDEMLGREVAVKEVVLPDGLTPDQRAEYHARTMREARTTAALNHPNVVKIYDVVRVDEHPFIVMEYVPSRSLHDLVTESGPLSPARTAQIGVAVLDALTAAHRAGVLHRDVKPGNVLIGHDGRVVLTDFGLATFDGRSDLTRPGLVLGSPQFVAPERARDGSSTPEADLWSLGATLYAAVEGRSPYERSTAMATLTALATSLPDPPRQAGALRPVLAGLLRRNPRDRTRPVPLRELLVAVARGERPGRRWRLPRPRKAGPDLKDRAPMPAAAPAYPAGPATVPRPVVPDPAAEPDQADPDQAVPAGAAAGSPRYPAYSGDLDRPGGPGPAPVYEGPTSRLSTRTADDLPPPPPAPGRGGARTRWWIAAAAATTAAAVGVAALALATRPAAPRPGPASPAAGPVPAAAVDPVLRGLCPAGPGRSVVPASRRPDWDALAGGWVWYLDPSGFRLGVRPDWTVHSGASGVCFGDPGSARVLAVRFWTPAGTTALAHLRQQERDLAAGTGQPPGYRLVDLVAVPYFQDAAEWEYTYDGPAGVPMHAHVREFQAPQGHGFTIGWLDRDADWQLDLSLLRLAEGSFVPPTGG